jgi:hypothetical protein
LPAVIPDLLIEREVIICLVIAFRKKSKRTYPGSRHSKLRRLFEVLGTQLLIRRPQMLYMPPATVEIALALISLVKSHFDVCREPSKKISNLLPVVAAKMKIR